MNKKIIGLLLITFILLNGLIAAISQENIDNIPTLMLINIKAKKIAGVSSLIFTDMVYEILNKEGAFKLMTPNEASRMFQNKKFKQSDSTSAKYIIKAGKVLGVDKVITGEYSKTDDGYVLSFKLFDIKSGQVEKEYTKEFKDVGEKDYLLGMIALKLSGKPILGEINVSSNVENADIYLDGNFTGKTPFIIKNVPVGEHKIKLSKTGFEDREKDVNLEEDNLNEKVKIDLKLKIMEADELTLDKVKLIWKPQNSGTDKNLNGIFALDENTAWAVGDYGIIIHTEDGGNTWMPQDSGLKNALSDVCFVDRLNGWAVGTAGASIKTEDGGNTWKKLAVEFMKNIFGFSVYQNNYVHLINKEKGCFAGNASNCGGPSYIAYTDDGGQNIKDAIFFHKYTVNTLFFINDNLGYLLGTKDEEGISIFQKYDSFNIISITRDGGKNWEVREMPLKHHKEYYYCMYFPEEDKGWIASTVYNSNGTAKIAVIYYTDDGGKTLTEAYKYEEPCVIKKIHFFDKYQGWAFGMQIKHRKSSREAEELIPFVLYTSDGGQNWKRVEFYEEVIPRDVDFVNSSCGWLVSKKGMIYKYENK